jgi:hypothetical protein
MPLIGNGGGWFDMERTSQVNIHAFLEQLDREGYFSTESVHSKIEESGQEVRGKWIYLWGSVQTALAKKTKALEMVIVCGLTGDPECPFRNMLKSMTIEDIGQFQESEIVPGLYEADWQGLCVSVSEDDEVPGHVRKICVSGGSELVDGSMMPRSLDQARKEGE